MSFKENSYQQISFTDSFSGLTAREQKALEKSWAKVFADAVNLTSVALTKLDGSAKGAIVLAVAKEMKLPVKLVGIGEKMEDLKDFNSDEFIHALFE